MLRREFCDLAIVTLIGSAIYDMMHIYIYKYINILTLAYQYRYMLLIINNEARERSEPFLPWFSKEKTASS